MGSEHTADGMGGGVGIGYTDGTDAAGRRVASGSYMARFEAGGVVQTQRLMLVK